MFRIRGIQLSVHFTFLLLLAYIGWDGWQAEGGVGAAVNVAAALVFFSCVVLHELGHAFMARAFGARVPRILLLPIGGMAELTSIPRRPLQEILIALAGPAVNFAIILLLSFFTPMPSWFQIQTLQLSPLQLLVVMNLTMGCFNLIPCFPMDGGRVLRALLASRFPYLRATRIAVALAKVVAVIGIVCMLTLPAQPHWMAVILFCFIMVAGELEYRAIARQELEEQEWRAFLDRMYGQRAESPRLT